jgi:hypothetical protein
MLNYRRVDISWRIVRLGRYMCLYTPWCFREMNDKWDLTISVCPGLTVRMWRCKWRFETETNNIVPLLSLESASWVACNHVLCSAYGVELFNRISLVFSNWCHSLYIHLSLTHTCNAMPFCPPSASRYSFPEPDCRNNVTPCRGATHVVF